MKKTTFALVILFLLFGCATIPEEKREIETRDTVFYPPLPQRPRLQFLHSITSEDDLGRTQSAMKEFLLGKPQSQKRIGRPYDVGSSKGKIYVLDRQFKKLLIIDLANKNLDFLDDRRLGNLKNPSGIWISEDDIKYVADMERKQVVVFDKDDEFLRTYGDKDLLDRPVDVAVYGSRVYVVDMNKSQIFVLDKDTGDHISTIGETGKDDGKFYKPTHVTVDHSGNIYINDSFNYRIQKFGPDGKFLKSFGLQGDTIGSFARPKGIAIDREGNMYVADAAFENVQIFDAPSGQLLLFFGGAGQAPGSMYLPAGVHIDYSNVEYFSKFADREFSLKYLLYVTNSFGKSKLNVYGYGEWVGPPLSGEKSTGAAQESENAKE